MIIGISGKKRSGKDTIYELVKKRAGGFVTRAAFGDQIKEEVAQVTGVAVGHIEENKERFGTTTGRVIGWIECFSGCARYGIRRCW